MESCIFFQGLRFYAYHGVAPQETRVGNEFTIDLRLHADLSQAMATDNVADTINYAEVFETIQKEMVQPSKLLEHIAGRIVHRLFQEFPGINAVELRLMKRNPPMGADIELCGIEIKETRPSLSK
ncbi:dihydroneopterin aldolase [Bacteroidales bacterium SW292]|nr:dihydroneopterin aldolase [Bacteroidales bacterium SW292]